MLTVAVSGKENIVMRESRNLAQRAKDFLLGKKLGFQRGPEASVEEFEILDFVGDITEDGVTIIHFVGEKLRVSIVARFFVFLYEKKDEEWVVVGEEGENMGLIYKWSLAIDGVPLDKAIDTVRPRT